MSRETGGCKRERFVDVDSSRKGGRRHVRVSVRMPTNATFQTFTDQVGSSDMMMSGFLMLVSGVHI